MGVQTRVRGERSLARRASVLIAIPALVLAIALGGCRASGARNGNGNGNGNGAGNSSVPVTQSTSGTGSSSATTTSGSSGSGSNAALQQLEQLDSQNQTDQQQLGATGSDASVDYSSQSNPIQP